MDWLDLLAVQGTLKSLLQHHSSETSILHWIIEKAREFQKNIYFCFMDYSKAFDCVGHNKLWRWEYQTIWPASWEICIQVKKQQLELDMEQQVGSKLGKE